MQRRDISKLLLSTGVAAGVSTQSAASLPSVERVNYPLTQAENEAKVSPKNLAFPEGDARRYGAIGDGIADDSAAIQDAVNFCVKSGRGLLLDGRFLLTTPINVDRLENAPKSGNYFVISSSAGGGFLIKRNMPMFSCSMPFHDAPLSVLTYFRGVYFESSAPGLGYVLDDGRFLRTRFDGCSFNKILACNCTIRYSQSVQFTNCNMRFGKGTFWTSGAGRGFSTDDFKFSDNIVEAWEGDVLNLGIPIGCAITNNLMEGISGTAIITSGAQGLLVSGNYFEANGLDLDTTSGGWPCHGLAFIGNRTHPRNLKSPSVLWSAVGAGCVSMGNYSGGNLHHLPPGSFIQINDFAAGSVWDNPPARR
jgi:hypothetical protein